MRVVQHGSIQPYLYTVIAKLHKHSHAAGSDCLHVRACQCRFGWRRDGVRAINVVGSKLIDSGLHKKHAALYTDAGTAALPAPITYSSTTECTPCFAL